MSRYIDADKFLNDLEELQKPHDIGFGEESTLVSIHLKALINLIKDLPTTDVVEAKHGEWFPIDVGDCCYRCSVCNFVRDAYLLEEDNYCPHCGARMDGEK